MFLFLFLTCAPDVSIMKIPGADTQEDNIEIDTAWTNTSSLISGFATIHFRQIACPACVGETSEFDITAELLLHQPTSGDYFENLTNIGSCTTTIYDTHVSVDPLQASTTAFFNDIQLQPVGAGIWQNNYLYEHQYERNADYTISSEHGIVSNAFTSIEGFDSIEPYTLLWIDPSYAFETVISKTSTTFTWSPVVPNTQFEILIAVYSPDGSQFLGALSCMENDTGHMSVPGSYFQNYQTWSLVAVHLIRHRTDRVEATDFSGHVQSHMKWEVVGTGHIE